MRRSHVEKRSARYLAVQYVADREYDPPEHKKKAANEEVRGPLEPAPDTPTRKP
jgi:hypothetical protein